jgi:hypothetical protein
MKSEVDVAGAARAIALCAGILCLLAVLAGCGETFQVRVQRPVAQPAQWAIAVFPLDDPGAKETISDFTVYGRVGAQGSGAMFARAISRAVGASGRFRSMDETALRNLMLGEKLTAAEFSALDDRRAGALGRKLGANLVVRGKVAAFDKYWLLFLPRTKVLLELRGLDSATGETIWSAAIGDSSGARSQTALISRIASEALRAIAEGVGAPR